MHTNLSEEQLIALLWYAIEERGKHERNVLKCCLDSSVLTTWKEEYRRLTTESLTPELAEKLSHTDAVNSTGRSYTSKEVSTILADPRGGGLTPYQRVEATSGFVVEDWEWNYVRNHPAWMWLDVTLATTPPNIRLFKRVKRTQESTMPSQKPTRTVYCVIWDCNNPRAVAVFDDKGDAVVFCEAFKKEIEALMKRISGAGNERVYVWESVLNPPNVEALSKTVHE